MKTAIRTDSRTAAEADAELKPPVQQAVPRTRITVIVIAMIATGISVLWLLYKSHTDMSIPIAYHDDSLYVIGVFKAIGEGNPPLQNARLAAPFGGSDWHDFPQYQWIDFLIYRLLCLFTHSYINLLNWYWVLTILATAGTAAYSFLRLRAAPVVACCLAFLFATQPFIFVRNITHFMLVAYLVPLLATVCLEVALGRWNEPVNKSSPRDIPIYAWLAFLLQGISFFYFSFFGALLLLVAAFLGFCARRTLRPFVQCAWLILVLVVSCVVGVSPTLLHWSRHGSNPIVTARSAAEAESNGLKIRHMLTPVPDHPAPLFRELASRVATEHPEHTESTGTRLGLLASIGFVGLILFVLASLSGWRFALDDGTVRGCAALLLAALLWCTVGGFGSVFNTYITPLIRGYDRIIVFILFFILASYGTVATRFLTRKSWARTNFKLAALVLVLITAAAFADALWFVPQTPEIRRQASAERELVSEVERRLGRKGMVFEIPYMPFASGSGPTRMGAFDQARPYLQSANLQWSWGTVNGTMQEHWAKGVSELPPEAMVRELVEKGFRGLWIDTYGYADSTTIPAKHIATLLARPPVVSSDGRYLFFDLSGASLPPVPTLQDSLPRPYKAYAIHMSGTCNVDAINWKGISGVSLQVNRLSVLRLEGWVADVDKGIALPDVYVELDGADGKQFYLHGYRTQRPDVASAFNKQSLIESGFVASGKLSNLPQGSHSIRILQLGPNGGEACDCGFKLDVK
jgi:phosphoglycerol transferase